MPDEEVRSVFLSGVLLSDGGARSLLDFSEVLRVAGGEDVSSGSLVREPDIPLVEANRWLGSTIGAVVRQWITCVFYSLADLHHGMSVPVTCLPF